MATASRSSSRRPLVLSPSRANDFKTCPLLFRLRAIDRIAEPKSYAQVLGTAVHHGLEKLFTVPPPQRTRAVVLEHVSQWIEQAAPDELPADLTREEFATRAQADASVLIDMYALIENPQGFSPESTEKYVKASTDQGTPLHGFVDRIDVSPEGHVRLVDYKTGKKPWGRFAAGAEFQMRFYALVHFKTTGEIPAQLKLIYLKDGTELTSTPTQADVQAAEQEVDQLWTQIMQAAGREDFTPTEGSHCKFCAHHQLCPAKGGVTPPWPGLA